MNTVEIRKAALSAAIEKANMHEIATQIGDASFIVPVEVEGVTRYVEFKATVKNNKDTKTVKAFNLEEAVDSYNAEMEARAEAERQAAEAKAAKPKKSSRKVSAE